MGTEEPTKTEAGVNPGERLRAARERAGWTVEQVALRLRLAPTQVRALETGRREDLPPAAYVRGYLRSYAQLLGLDPQEFAKARASEEGNAPPQPMAPRTVPEGRNRVGGVLYGLLLIAIVAGMLWWHERPPAPARLPASQLLPAQPTGVLPPRLTSLAAASGRHGDTRTFPLAGSHRSARPSRSAAAPRGIYPPHPVYKRSAPKDARAPRVVARLPSSRRQVLARMARSGAASARRVTPHSRPPAVPATVTATVAPPSAVPNPGGLVSLPQGRTYVGLRIRANDGAIHVTVRDARGVRLMAGQVAPGQAVHVMGRAPFHLTLSQSQGVAVSIGGRAVTLPNAQTGQNVRVTVDP